MKRVKRAKMGNLNKRQRKRINRRLRALRQGGIEAFDQYGSWSFLYCRHDSEIRDARRMAEAGLIVAVVSKSLPWRPIKEIELFMTREEALKRYPSHRIMRSL